MRVESGRPGLSLLTSLLVSVDVKSIEPCFGIGHLSLICQLTSEDIKHQLIIIKPRAEFDISVQFVMPQ